MAKDKVTVRVLAHIHHEGKEYKPNQLVAFDADAAKGHVKAGNADDAKAAVDYLRAEGVAVVEHVKAEEPKADEKKEGDA